MPSSIVLDHTSDAPIASPCGTKLSTENAPPLIATCAPTRAAYAVVEMPRSDSFVAYTAISADVRSMRISRVRHGTLASSQVSRWIPGCGSDENVSVGLAAATRARIATMKTPRIIRVHHTAAAPDHP